MRTPNLWHRLFNNPLFTTVTYGVIWGALFTINTHPKKDASIWVINLPFALAFGAWLTFSQRRQLRRMDEAIGIQSLAQRVTLQYALKTAELPSDQHIRSLLPTYLDYLEERQKHYAKVNRLLPLLFGAIYVLNIVLTHSWIWVAIGAVCMVLVLWSIRMQQRNHEHILRLRAVLAQLH